MATTPQKGNSIDEARRPEEANEHDESPTRAADPLRRFLACSQQPARFIRGAGEGGDTRDTTARILFLKDRLYSSQIQVERCHSLVMLS